MPNLRDIKTEIDTDPLTRGYSGMTDQQVLDDLNTAYRESPASGEEVRDYLMKTEFRNSSVWGRLKMLADHTVSWNGTTHAVHPLPLGNAGADQNQDVQTIAAAKALVEYVQSGSSGSLKSGDWDTILNHLKLGASNAQVFDDTIKSAIQAFSENQMTRAAELGLGRLRVSHITEARALP